MKNSKIGRVAAALLVGSAALFGIVAWRGNGIANAGKPAVISSEAPRAPSPQAALPTHHAPTTPTRLPKPVAAPAEPTDALPPVEEPDPNDLRQFPAGRRYDLDERIAAEPPDEQWRDEMAKTIDKTIATWPNAKVLLSQCGQTICRMDFSSSAAGTTTEQVMNAVYHLQEIPGELVLEGDERSDPPTITAYFTRSGGIHLNKPQPRPSTPTPR